MKKEVQDVVSRMEWKMQQRESRPSTSASHDSFTQFQADGMLQTT